jgi:hypothetical protein
VFYESRFQVVHFLETRKFTNISFFVLATD